MGPHFSSSAKAVQDTIRKMIIKQTLKKAIPIADEVTRRHRCPRELHKINTLDRNIKCIILSLTTISAFTSNTESIYTLFACFISFFGDIFKKIEIVTYGFCFSVTNTSTYDTINK